MELAINQVVNFSPSMLKFNNPSCFNNTVNTTKLSYSDIPNEVEIIQKNSTLFYIFDYTIMEGENNLIKKTDTNWSFTYSNITGRIYKIEFNSNHISKLKQEIKFIRRTFSKNRLKDNIKFGLDLMEAIYSRILQIEKENNYHLSQ